MVDYQECQRKIEEVQDQENPDDIKGRLTEIRSDLDGRLQELEHNRAYAPAWECTKHIGYALGLSVIFGIASAVLEAPNPLGIGVLAGMAYVFGLVAYDLSGGFVMGRFMRAAEAKYDRKHAEEINTLKALKAEVDEAWPSAREDSSEMAVSPAPQGYDPDGPSAGPA